jgi:uncharacterized protein involved in exopolysaccharide biosynthesis
MFGSDLIDNRNSGFTEPFINWWIESRMSSQQTNPHNHRLQYLLKTLKDYQMYWIVPAVAGFVLAALYVVFLRGETWSARQSLIVRDDLLGQSFKPGRFESLESMKSAQETILEIARKPQVIRNALKSLGPEKKSMFFGVGADYPSENLIETVQGSISLSAPNGAELGKTEVIVLNAKGSTRERAREFIELMMDEIIVKTNEVRALRFQSMVGELEQARDSAWASLNESKKRLRQMNETLGPDMGTLGSFSENQSGDGSLQRDRSQVRLEKRAVQSELESATKVLEMLVGARQNPQQIINTSGDLVKYQPSLDILKKELVAAQKVLAIRIGQYTEDHPQVISAKGSIDAMRNQIYQELNSSIAAVEQDLNALRQKQTRLDNEIDQLDGRLNRVSASRVDSLTLVAEVRKRTEIANNAESSLQEVQSLSQTGNNVALITKVDEPQVSTRPDGLGKKSTILAGALGGLFVGLGIVMLLAPPMDPLPMNGSQPHPHAGYPGQPAYYPQGFYSPMPGPPPRISPVPPVWQGSGMQSELSDYDPMDPTVDPDGSASNYHSQPGNQHVPNPLRTAWSSAAETRSSEYSIQESPQSVVTPAEKPRAARPATIRPVPQVQEPSFSTASTASTTPAPIAQTPTAPVPETKPLPTSTPEPEFKTSQDVTSNVQNWTQTKAQDERQRLQQEAEERLNQLSGNAEQPATNTLTEPSAAEPSVAEPSVAEPSAAEPHATKQSAAETVVVRSESATIQLPQDELGSPQFSAFGGSPANQVVDDVFAAESATDELAQATEMPNVHSNAEVPNLSSQPNLTQPNPTQANPTQANPTQANPTQPSDPTESMNRRASSVRPVDLAKAAEESFDRVEPKDETREKRVNPFLKDRKPKEPIDDASENPEPADDTRSSAPVPDQIKKLSNAIASFAKPIKPKPDSSDDF